ncbi:hypothetical protein [Actinomadura verrucosospora]|uniref:hypothetical protein n=1 Tax=Actinomadura verrucosospora TaxID=46165 RepID=UPI0015663977|nr:hypothetical protein [Actinomadura verrucosospora]
MLAIGAVALLIGRPKPRSRPWWWLAIPAAAARSPHWALAAALYVLPGAASALTNPPPNVQDTGYWPTLTALLLAMTSTA